MRDFLILSLIAGILAFGLLKAVIEFNPMPRPAAPHPAAICEHDGQRKLCRDTFTQQDI